jgi:hypothetical protein
MAPDCSICCEKFNKSNRKKITCSFCQTDCCNTCAETYLLGTSQDPHCMSCRNEWLPEFLEVNFTKTFRLITYKKHREEVLYERQKAMLPGAQPAVEREIHAVEILAKKKELLKKKKDLDRQRLELQKEIDNVRADYFDTLYGAKGQSKAEARQFIKACPADDCRGFLNQQWHCGLCKTDVCCKCREIKKPEEEHVCDPKILESIKLIESDSRQCPKCPSIIFKIEGCNQMFCTQCHAVFDFRTGRIENGPVHNPHFYEWAREQNNGVIPRNIGDVPCGGMPGFYDLHNHMKPHRKVANFNAFEKEVTSMYRFLIHIDGVVMNLYRPPPIGSAKETNEDLRVNYLLKRINEDQFKATVQRREKQRVKNRAIYQILELFKVTGMELFQSLMQIKTCEALKKTFKDSQLWEIVNYCNSHLLRVSNRYNCVVPQIDLVEYKVINKYP